MSSVSGAGITVSPQGVTMYNNAGTVTFTGSLTGRAYDYTRREETLPEITPGGLEALAERLDLLALEHDMPELLEISEALAKHFYTHERLSDQIKHLLNAGDKNSDHNPRMRDRDRMDALAYQRYTIANKPFKIDVV